MSLRCFDFKLPSDRSAMGTRRTKAKVDASLLPSDAARFSWVSNKVLAMKSDYRTNTNLDELDSLPLNGPNKGEEWIMSLSSGRC